MKEVERGRHALQLLLMLYNMICDTDGGLMYYCCITAVDLQHDNNKTCDV